MKGPPETIRTMLVPAEDLPPAVVYLAIAVTLVGLLLLAIELRRAREARRAMVLVSGLVAAVVVLAAIVRPHRMRSREVNIAPRVVVLLDRSRSMALSADASGDGRARIDVAEEATRALQRQLGGRVEVLSFGGAAGVKPRAAEGAGLGVMARADEPSSDLGAALRAVRERHEDPPAAIVVVSDGRVQLADPLETRRFDAPVLHTVAIGEASPPDAAIRAVRLAGAAVAHQVLPIRVEVACTGGLSCGDLTISIRELREGDASSSSHGSLPADQAILATGTATLRDGTATVELPVTLERAGVRALEVSLAAPKGDAIPENDRRLLTIDVARERVRVLHVAGRPTFDVRALRTWLKSDAAVDVVSFFILRTPGDDVNAPDDELALIPFPVRELFTEYLPTFDAIIFQDFDAEPYSLTPHLPSIARYVEHGGGLVHVGGPNAFSAGGYAGSPLARVTPVEIPRLEANAQAADSAPFVPRPTVAARGAPILAELDAVVGDDLPELAGTSILGDVREGGVALWTHPRRKTATGRPMPVLAIGDIGDGRSIALGVDSTQRFAFSTYAAKYAGRGYETLWRGLLGWLMRDPRYEPVRGRLVRADGTPPCLAGAETSLRIEASPVAGPARLRAVITPIAGARQDRAGASEAFPASIDTGIDGPPPVLVPLGVAPAGAFALRMGISTRSADAPPESASALGALATRTLAACERGGDEWADPRPDRVLLERLAQANGGVAVGPGDLRRIPAPRAAVVSIERTVSPLLPAWAWATLGAIASGLHWFIRRRGGLA